MASLVVFKGEIFYCLDFHFSQIYYSELLYSILFYCFTYLLFKRRKTYYVYYSKDFLTFRSSLSLFLDCNSFEF